MHRFLLAAAITAILLAPALSLAQSAGPLVEVRGEVLDASRAPIKDAVVTALREKATSTAAGTTDARGTFGLALEPGAYTLVASAPGFRDRALKVNVAPGLGAQALVLEVAGLREAVTVTAPPTYRVPVITSATKTATPLLDLPQSVTVVSEALVKDQLMTSIGDLVRYIPGISSHQGENNRDQIVVRGNTSSADFFVNGVRDDVQYYRDVYNLSRLEALKGPNAMIFGRGGAGGVINRVTKHAVFEPVREFTLQGGAFGDRRMTADVDQPLNRVAAFRLNAMYEAAGSFRSGVDLARYGLSPLLTVAPSNATTVTVEFERLHDRRVADRGMTSFAGKPIDLAASTYFGDPNDSHVDADVNVGALTIEHRSHTVLARNHTSLGHYDRGYQNFVPGVVTADRSRVTLTAYNNATNRLNLFNQTDLTGTMSTGALRHTWLAGAELGRQWTDNVRHTGFFNDNATSLLVDLAHPTVDVPVTFRQSATDADNHLVANVAATYVQDQIELSHRLQVVAGLRFDRFDLTYHNNRNGDTLSRVDNLISPRAGVVFKARSTLSLYGSYSVTALPSSGDQFSSLTTVTAQVEPEQFTNYEVGVKWDARPGLALTTAAYRLDRTNTRATDPNDATRIVQTGSQRTNGYEIGINGSMTRVWSVAGGYAYQHAFVTSATTAAAVGAEVGQVPHQTFSLWNNLQLHPRLATGLGFTYRTDMFAAFDNTVTLPGYARVDGAVFYSLRRDIRVQVNVENLLDRTYFVNADSNTNISPGSPRAVRVGLTARF